MNDLTEEAKRIVFGIESNMGAVLAEARATVAIALALIAIAEELEKLNEK